MPDSVSPTKLVSRDAGACSLLTLGPSTELRAHQGLPHQLLLALCSCSHGGLIWDCLGWFVLVYGCAVWKRWEGRGVPMCLRSPWLCIKEGHLSLSAALCIKRLGFVQPLFINTSKSFPP